MCGATQRRLHYVRGLRVMLDAELAALYGVETRVLIQAVKRNTDRFPIEFMFQLTADEAERSRSQNVILSVTGMTNEQEVKVQTRGPDRGNPTSRRQGLCCGVTTALAKGNQRREAREGRSERSHRCVAVSNESEVP